MKNLSKETEIFFGGFEAEIIRDKIANRKYLVVTSNYFKNSGLINKISKAIGYEPLSVISDVPSCPSIDYLNSKKNQLQNPVPEVIVAIGGGSCIDTAKVLARLAESSLGENVESILASQIISKEFKSTAIIAIPTTTGTGSEVTPFATVWDYNKGNKYSIAGEDLKPEWALIFPSLSLSAPTSVLIASSLDALSHAFDSIWNKNSTTNSLRYSYEALASLIPTLAGMSFDTPTNLEIENLATGSLSAGLAIAITQTSLSHSISYPLTYKYRLAHGLASSFSLPEIINYIAKHDTKIFDKITSFGGSNNNINVQLFFENLFKKSKIYETFLEKIPDKNSVQELIPNMTHPDRSKNFMFELTDLELRDILARSLSKIYD
jgi:alcohol dehydrogenase class IV